MSMKLTPESQAPGLSLPLVGGGTFDLAAEAPDNFTMVVFYRGHHCPVCKGYLQKLDALIGKYQDAGFSVVAVSMNGGDLAAQTAADWGLQNTAIAHSLSLDDAKNWGLWISSAIKDAEADVFCEPGLFWVRPDGRIYLIDISNMPWARPDLEFLLSKVPFAVDNGYPERGTHAG